MGWLRRFVVELVGLVLVQPVRRGRVRAQGWPRGLGPVVGVALGGYLLAGLLVVAAGPLRRLDDLATSTEGDTLPDLALAPLLLLVTLALSLAFTSGLHAHRWATTAITVLVGVQLVLVGVLSFPTAGPGVLLVTLTALTGLLVLILVRRRRSFAWFEFALVTGLVVLGLVVPLLMTQGGQRQLGFDSRVLSVTQLFVLLSPLAIPALMIGGAALVEIAVAAAGWGLRLVRDDAPRPVWRALAVALVVVGLAGVAWRLREDRWALLTSAVPLLLAVTALVLLRAPWRPVDDQVAPDELVAAWPRLLVPLAVGSCALLLPSVVAVAVQVVATAAGHPGGGALDALVLWLTSSQSVGLLRLLMVLVAVALALRWARRGEHARPLLLVSFAALLLPNVIGVLSGSRVSFPRTDDALAADVIVLAVLLLVAFAVARQLTARRLTALMLVLALSGCYVFRQVLADPVGLVLGASAVALTLFGLLWRLLTDAGWTHSGSAAFPLPTRVLFFWANALLAVSSLAFVALGRSSGGVTDVTGFTVFGDHVLGTPLYLAAVLGCLWQVLHADRAPVLPTEDDSVGDHLGRTRYAVEAGGPDVPGPASPNRVLTPGE
ncbi:hypothetical protein [Auraticoccus monumenti]|uniref:Uncharacterized protein n=1 Tax=Auraticoccus monumenti TaxID=675864 RepID=A0A1G6ZEN9_9ACTN|nr:hypothetical protein [Auraticoccus monumenti]SDE00667.1 hypothetical protein SAMN04489747_2260 [Auraticoccus monumenti]